MSKDMVEAYSNIDVTVMLRPDCIDWYRQSWPNRSGMTLGESRISKDGYVEITEIYRDGKLVGRRYDMYY